MKTKTATRVVLPGSSDRKFWTEFLVLYQSQSALWDMGNENYKDRCAKIKSYDLLKEKLREQLPGATRDDVLRRINIFRTNYRRERMRALKYRERGSNYQTSLWYFKLLSFLEPQILVKSRTRKTEQRHSSNKTEFHLQNQFKTENNIFDTTNNDSLKCLPTEKASFVADEHGVEEMEDLEYFFDDDGRITVPCSDEMKQKNNNDETMETNNDNVQYKYANSIAEDFEQSSTPTTRLDEFVLTDEEGNDMEITHDKTHENPIRVNETATPYSLYPTEIHHKLSLKGQQTKQKQEQQKSATTTTPVVPAAQPQQQQINSTEKSSSQLSTTSEILARSWAVQYDEMTTEQKIYARKEIADILFAGCMGQLGLKS